MRSNPDSYSGTNLGRGEGASIQSTPPSDAELLERFVVDLWQALADVQEAYGDRLLGRLRLQASRMSYGDVDVEDVYAETLLQLVDPAYRSHLKASGGQILPYLTRFGYWRLADSARRRPAELPDDLEDSAPPAEMIRKPSHALVRRALGTLAPRDRDILLLRHVQGRSNRDVAIEFGISERAAKKAAHDARERLRRALAEEGFEL